MEPTELLRLVDTLHREKDIDAESVFEGIEAALLSAARKHLGASDDLIVTIDRETGEIVARDGDREIDPSELGRIAAQTAKQVMIQKIREAERDSISQEFTARVGTLVAGIVQRFEGPNIIVSLHRTEGLLPRSEQIFNETYHVGERIRAMILEVRAVGTRVRVVLTRSHPDFVKELFHIEVPEVTEHLVEIAGIAREPGHRTKIAVHSIDPRVDCVGACVGVQGSRIKSIVDELNGEKIDIVRWSDEIDVLIANTLRPALIDTIDLDEETKHAIITVPDDQLSLAIGKRGQNVRLAAKLTGWDIDIQSNQPPPPPEATVTPDAPVEAEAESDAPAKAEAESAESVVAEVEPDASPEADAGPAVETDEEPIGDADSAQAEPETEPEAEKSETTGSI